MRGLTMISFLLLALLGTGLAAFAVESFGDDGEETSEPTAETDIIQGTNQPDILEAMENQTVNGFAGDDTIEAVGDGALVNGGPGDDRLFSFVGEDVTLNGGGGSDHIVFQSNGSEDSDLSFVQGGSGDDTIDAFGEDGVIDGGAGNDIISIQGTLLSASGGAGDDTISGDSADLGAEHHFMAMPVTTFSFWKTRQAIKLVPSPMVAQETIGSKQAPILTAQTRLTP